MSVLTIQYHFVYGITKYVVTCTLCPNHNDMCFMFMSYKNINSCHTHEI